jgi:hypothetical protein
MKRRREERRATRIWKKHAKSQRNRLSNYGNNWDKPVE